MNQPFAAVADLEAAWRPLTDQEISVAEKLLDYASNKVRVRWSDIDARIEAGDVTELTLEEVVVGMVKRAMLAGGREGVTTDAQSAGPFSTSVGYANPMGNLYLSKDDVAMIDPKSSGKAFSVDLSPSGAGYDGCW